MASATKSENDTVVQIDTEWRYIPITPETQAFFNLAFNMETGWGNIQDVYNCITANDGVITEGPRHNRTDGEVHWYVIRNDGQRCEFNGSYWEGGTFVPLLIWFYNKG